MASCEKCWEDAYERSLYSSKDQAECYRDLLEERRDDPCTPEEQAGKEAIICPQCNRKTIHQYAKVCMNPKCNHRINK